MWFAKISIGAPAFHAGSVLFGIARVAAEREPFDSVSMMQATTRISTTLVPLMSRLAPFGNREGLCADSSSIATGMNYTCRFYSGRTAACGEHDDHDFTAADLCCSCGGGRFDPVWTVAEAVPAFAKELTVDSTAGFTAGDEILLSGGGVAEVRTVAAVSSKVLQVSGGPFVHDYPLGATVTKQDVVVAGELANVPEPPFEFSGCYLASAGNYANGGLAATWDQCAAEAAGSSKPYFGLRNPNESSADCGLLDELPSNSSRVPKEDCANHTANGRLLGSPDSIAVYATSPVPVEQWVLHDGQQVAAVVGGSLLPLTVGPRFANRVPRGRASCAIGSVSCAGCSACEGTAWTCGGESVAQGGADLWCAEVWERHCWTTRFITCPLFPVSLFPSTPEPTQANASAPTPATTGSPTPPPSQEVASTPAPSEAPTQLSPTTPEPPLEPTQANTSAPTPATTGPPTPPPSQEGASTPAPSEAPTQLSPPTPEPPLEPTQDNTSAPTPATTAPPTPLPSQEGASTPAPSEAPTQLSPPTPEPTLEPTQANTSAPTPTPPGLPTPAPTRGASATGDPHVTNVDGAQFNIMKVGVHEFLRLPRRANQSQGKGWQEEGPLLAVSAKVERADEELCHESYVKQVDVTGSWLNSSGPLRFRVAGDSPGDAAAVAVWVNGSLVGREALGRESKRWPFLEVVEPRSPHAKPASSSIQRVPVLTVRLVFGPATLQVDWVHRVAPGRPPLNHLNFQALGLRGFARTGMDIGGILGRDDHSDAASTPEDCKSSSSDLRVSTRGSGKEEGLQEIVASL